MDITGIITALICHIFRLTLRGDCTRLDDEGDVFMNGINNPARLGKERITLCYLYSVVRSYLSL